MSVDILSTSVASPMQNYSCQEDGKAIQTHVKDRETRSISKTSFCSIEAEIIYCDMDESKIDEPLTPSTVMNSEDGVSSSCSCSSARESPVLGPGPALLADQESDDEDYDIEMDLRRVAAENRDIRRSATPRVDERNFLQVQLIPKPSGSQLWQRRMMLRTVASPEGADTAVVPLMAVTSPQGAPVAFR